MPKTVANFKCNKCGDVFTATSEEYTSCKCGLCRVQPTYYRTNYSNTDGKGIYFERLCDGHDHTYYNQDEFYVMKGDILELFKEVECLCKELEFYLYYDYERDENNNEILGYIEFSKMDSIDEYYIEHNEIHFEKRFKNEYFSDEKEAEYKDRLIDFKRLLIKLKNKEIKFSDRNAISEEAKEWGREQITKYDYDFYF